MPSDMEDWHELLNRRVPICAQGSSNSHIDSQALLLAPKDQGDCIDAPTGVVAINSLHHVAKILIVAIKFYGLPVSVRSLQNIQAELQQRGGIEEELKFQQRDKLKRMCPLSECNWNV